MSGGAIEAFSAGSAPKPLHPNAIRVMREDFGLDIADHASKHLDRFAAKRFDFVVSLCDRVREVCPEFPGHPQTAHWSIANPVTGEDDAATLPLFRATAAEIATRTGFLLALLADRTTRTT
jgi:protein-tyrosine-phosphatase